MLPTRLIPEGGEPEGRRSTRHFLSRLFSRRSSQDSSSGSSSVRSLDDDSPSTGGESVDSDECARMPSVEPGTGGSEATLGSLRNRRADLAPIRENNNDGYRSGPAQSRPSLWREPGVGTTNNTSTAGGSSSSWLSSSLRGRCPPLLSRLRRHVRDESAHSAASLEEGYSRPQHLLRRWDNLERTASQDEDDDEEGEEDDEEKEEGAVGAEAFGAGHPHPQCMYYYLSFFFISLHHSHLPSPPPSACCASSLWLHVDVDTKVIFFFFFALRCNFGTLPILITVRLSALRFVLPTPRLIII